MWMISNLCSGSWDCVHHVMPNIRTLSWNASMCPLRHICIVAVPDVTTCDEMGYQDVRGHAVSQKTLCH